MNLKAERLLTPLTFLAITAAVVIMPAERSHWNFDGTISFLASFGTTVAIFAIFALGLNVQWGYTGVFNFGVVGFFLVGAYTAGVITKAPPESEFVTYVGGLGPKLDFLPFLDSAQWLPFLIATIASASFCGILALLLSMPTLRLREDYLAIATLGVAELLRNIIIVYEKLGNGAQGLIGIPAPFEGDFSPGDYRFFYFFLALGVLILVFIAVERGIRSPWGRVLRALREDELTTAASGKDVFAYKTQGFVLGAVVMGIGGSVFAYERGGFTPETFTHFFGTFLFWVMLIVGGSGSNRGAILGAYMVWGLWQITLFLPGYPLPGFLKARIFSLRDLVLGALIISVLLLRPQGLIPEERRVSIWVERLRRRREQPSPKGAAKAPGPGDRE